MSLLANWLIGIGLVGIIFGETEGAWPCLGLVAIGVLIHFYDLRCIP